jgi:hypothetical protein
LEKTGELVRNVGVVDADQCKYLVRILIGTHYIDIVANRLSRHVSASQYFSSAKYRPKVDFIWI